VNGGAAGLIVEGMEKVHPSRRITERVFIIASSSGSSGSRSLSLSINYQVVRYWAARNR